MKAVVLAQKIAACLSIFITRADPTAALQGLGTGKNITDGSTQRQTTLEPGLIMYGQNGETIQQVNPAQPGSGFDTNVRVIIRLLGLGFGLPLEYALLDFSTVSGATAKASAQAAQRAFERVQRLLIDEYYSRVWRWRISKFIKDGELEDRDDAFNHRWHADRWPYLDVVKEIQGIQAEIDAGLTTETRELMSRGINVDQIQQERATELANKRKLGIPIYHANIMLEVGTKAPVSTEETVGSDTKDTNVPPTDPAGPTESPLAE
jgi:capsid protein